MRGQELVATLVYNTQSKHDHANVCQPTVPLDSVGKRGIALATHQTYFYGVLFQSYALHASSTLLPFNCVSVNDCNSPLCFEAGLGVGVVLLAVFSRVEECLLRPVCIPLVSYNYLYHCRNMRTPQVSRRALCNEMSLPLNSAPLHLASQHAPAVY